MTQKDIDQMSDQEFNEMLLSMKTTEIDVLRIEREARQLRAQMVREFLSAAVTRIVRRFSAQRGNGHQAGQTA
ncbi:RSP_7527 family protein [Alkalilacustris brevis]|uniref:RSP_7527 family protein n=1 Tax=Alkalilacustris brevis TaxID=2026338 RepID=UPI000E0D038F|nr:hypothetical protein [Alkalilacustris brevis]